MSISFSHEYFVCDICGIEEPPNHTLSQKIQENQLKEIDFPLHCGSSMRLTILEKELDTKYLIDLQTIKSSAISTIKIYLRGKSGNDTLSEQFENVFNRLFDPNIDEKAELFLSNLRSTFYTVAEQVSKDDKEISAIISIGEGIINQAIMNAIRRSDEGVNPLHKTGPILPGSKDSHSIEFMCQVCKEKIEVDQKLKNLLLNSDEEIELPLHHDKPIQIIIKQNKVNLTKPVKSNSTSSFFVTSNVEEMDITSVGIDIGSSTTHLIFSKISLRREIGFINMTGRYNIVNREILFESEIIDTPLLDSTTIDLDQVIEFCKKQYHLAGYKPEDVDTGAVIVTGETAKKQNALKIVNQVSDNAGKFVSAVAGPNLESLLGAMGSGAVARSLEKQNTILNVDIGGGTSNLSIVVGGQVKDTSCINVGGRVLGINSDNVIWRVDEPTKWLMQRLKMNYKIGDLILEKDLEKLVEVYALALIEVMKGKARTEFAKQLMMTNDMEFDLYKIDEIMFSGGVAELIFDNKGRTEFHDIGFRLAEYLRNYDFGVPKIEPKNKIRATVIGTGSYSLAVSGSTIFYDHNIPLPLTNVPTLTIEAKKENFSKENVIKEISKAFEKYDIVEGTETVALYFTDPIYARDMFIPDFVTAIETSLPNTIKNKQSIILVFKTDIGGTIGRHLKQITEINENFICLDEIELEEGDWIDIGKPLGKGDVFPVTIKSLVFN